MTEIILFIIYNFFSNLCLSIIILSTIYLQLHHSTLLFPYLTHYKC